MIYGVVRVKDGATGTSTIRGWIEAMDEASKPLSFKTTKKFEMIQAKAFARTQMQTHILSGSLKASGRPGSDFDGDRWTGGITYGGSLYRPPMGPGPANNPVDYAIYEQARGGQHDFFRGLEIELAEFEDAINDLFPG